MACRRARSMTVKKIVGVPARETEAEQGSDVNAESMGLDTICLGQKQAPQPCIGCGACDLFAGDFGETPTVGGQCHGYDVS